MQPWNKLSAVDFWQRVRKSDGCWLFMGPGRGQRDYGAFGDLYAHRYSWELHNGPIAKGLFVLHHCDVNRCVRPDHLFLGTQSDNMRDCVAKARHPETAKRFCKNGHEFSPDNTFHRTGNRGRPRRFCKACCRVMGRRYMQRKRNQQRAA